MPGCVDTRMTAANLANDQREALGLPAIGAGHMRIAAAATTPARAIHRAPVAMAA